MTAVIAVLSQIALPLPSGVPITLQTLAIALCGYILGSMLAPLSVMIYLALGAVGLPVFANFKVGIGVLFGVTGGFLWGFILFAAFCGAASACKNKILTVLLSLIGLLLCHFIGVIQFSLVTHTGLWQSALIASIPYLIKDALSALAAYLIAAAVKRALKSSLA
ncbi:Biotin transporter BioY [bioreactor metagenome]|uniref:Biotin transporter BioY n=1 Tax=bioreactor metagenome TaxID=1076179 RepID=A0A645J4W5_9ZZZZ